MNLRINKNTHQEQQGAAMTDGRDGDSLQGAATRTADRESSQGGSGHAPPARRPASQTLVSVRSGRRRQDGSRQQGRATRHDRPASAAVQHGSGLDSPLARQARA